VVTAKATSETSQASTDRMEDRERRDDYFLSDDVDLGLLKVRR
jgi:hypothetical protein